MSIGYVGEAYPLLGGWFGSDGLNGSDDFALTDGWFGEIPCNCDYLLERVTVLENLLKEAEPIYIGVNGHLYELDIGA